MRKKKKKDYPPKTTNATERTRKWYFHRSYLLLLVLLACSALFFFFGGPTRFCISMARTACAELRHQDAKRWLDWSHRFSDRNPEAEFLRARIARRNGDLQSMSEHLKKANEFGFDKLSLEREQDLGLAVMGRLSIPVESRIQKWLSESPIEADDIMESYLNGLIAMSRFEEASNLLGIWSESSPRLPNVNYRQARLHEHFFQYDEAEQQYRESLQKNPSYFKAAYHLARVLLKQRRPEEAIKFFERSNQASAGLASQIGVAGCYRTLGDLNKSRDTLLEVMKHSFEEMVQSFRSVDESPERFVAASELGCIETELGDFPAAREHLELALQRFPLDSVGRYSYAVALRGLGFKELAEENFEKTRAARTALDEVASLQEKLRHDPQNTEARLKIGQAVLQHESEATGVFWIQSVFAYDPSNQQAHQLLAEYFEHKPQPTTEDTNQAQYHRSFLIK